MPGTIQELLSNNEFVYHIKQSPKDNYIAFQQAICFSQGVEFLKTSNFSNKPVIVLLKVPVLSIDLAEAKKTLENFNAKLLEELKKLIDRSNNKFDIFMHFYELHKAVNAQQEEYRNSREQFFAAVTPHQFDFKEIKALKLPFVQTYIKSKFHDYFKTGSVPITLAQIGTEGVRHLEKLYLLRRKFNMKLLKELNLLKEKLFGRQSSKNSYKYTGDIADLVEVAQAITFSGHLTGQNGGSVTRAGFARDFLSFLGRTFSNVQASQSTIDKRILQKQSFLHRSIKALSGR
jgi:hypothetical protein